MLCRDCKNFGRCHWLISRNGLEGECDWSPSEYVDAGNLPKDKPMTHDDRKARVVNTPYLDKMLSKVKPEPTKE